MATQPPLFGKFGTTFNDLLTKKYVYKSQFIIKNNLTDEMTTEMKLGIIPSEKAERFEGILKATHKHKQYGVDSELETDTNGKVTGKVETKKLAKNFNFTLKGSNAPDGSVQADYRYNNVATGLKIDSSSTQTSVEANASVGYKGAALGLNTKYSVTANQVQPPDVSFEYVRGGCIFTKKVTNRFQNSTFSLHHQFAPRNGVLKSAVGVQVEMPFHNIHSSVVTVAGEHEFGSSTYGALKVDTRGTMACVLEHKFSNPSVKAAVAAQWDLKKKPKACGPADKVGIQLTFGDY